MAKPLVGHTVAALSHKKLRHPESSIDDDCVSENSFGSDFGDNATDEEDLKTIKSSDIYTELGSPPVYSEEEPLQSMVLLSNTDVKPPPVVLRYTPPTGSTEVKSASNVNFRGPPMCVVRGLSFNPTLTRISIN